MYRIKINTSLTPISRTTLLPYWRGTIAPYWLMELLVQVRLTLCLVQIVKNIIIVIILIHSMPIQALLIKVWNNR